MMQRGREQKRQLETLLCGKEVYQRMTRVEAVKDVENRSALILYGSETGNSEDAAESLGRIAERLRFVTHVVEMDAVDLSLLSRYTIVMFTVSTTGQGDMPQNCRKFWKSLLRKRLPPCCLSRVAFTIFGLGDSSYAKFNFASRKLFKRLVQLGAQQFYPVGEGDEQHEEGIDGAFLPWSLDLTRHLTEQYPLPEGVLPIPDEEFLPPRTILELEDSTKAHASALASTSSTLEHSARSHATLLTSDASPSMAIYNTLPVQLMRTSDAWTPSTPAEAEREANKPLKEAYAPEALIVDIEEPPADILPIPGAHIATIMNNDRLTAQDHFQDVRYLSMNISTSAIKSRTKEAPFYSPGDIVTLFPKNFPGDVEALIQLQNWQDIADVPLHLKYTSGAPDPDPLYLPFVRKWHTVSTPTIRSLLLHNFDITAIPRRDFFTQISRHTKDETHKERLREFGNPAHLDEFFDYATRPRRSILEILQDFHTVQLPFQYIAAFFPTLRGRQFSIASGGVIAMPEQDEHETVRIDLCIALVKYQTVLRKVRQGVCSRWVNKLKPGTKIAITIQKGSYPSLEPVLRRPVLMVAPGTGVAPMRSLIFERDRVKLSWERQAILNDANEQQPGKAMLIFGNRNVAKDWLFARELRDNDYIRSQITIKTAWSRNYPRGDKRNKYVQDVIRDSGWEIYKMLALDGGTVFVCGSSGKMPAGVKAALTDVYREYGRLNMDEAEERIAALEKDKRYVQETW